MALTVKVGGCGGHRGQECSHCRVQVGLRSAWAPEAQETRSRGAHGAQSRGRVRKGRVPWSEGTGLQGGAQDGQVTVPGST